MKKGSILLAMVAALAVAIIASVSIGARDIPLSAVLSALSGNSDTADAAAAYVRIPRTALGVIVGSSLAVAGLTMQGVTRNPLADPGIFGVLSGASLAAVIGIAFFGFLPGSAHLMVFAIIGATVSALAVYAIGSLGRGGATPLKLALAGAATSAAMSSLVAGIVLPRSDVMDSYRFWQIGSIGGAQWDVIAKATPGVVIGLVICFSGAAKLNAMALGDDVAHSLGVGVRFARAWVSAGAVILCGLATALAGPISFVGLIVPHVMRQWVSTDHRWLFPLSALAGATLVLLSDTLGRVLVRPNDLDVGVIMPLLGAPLFIWIIRSRKLRELA